MNIKFTSSHKNNEPESSVLYIVGTPIGNLSDLSPRALNVLKNSPLKVTTQRTRLIEILFKNGDHHFTAEDVHKEVDKNKYKITVNGATKKNTFFITCSF